MSPPYRGHELGIFWDLEQKQLNILEETQVGEAAAQVPGWHDSGAAGQTLGAIWQPKTESEVYESICFDLEAGGLKVPIVVTKGPDGVGVSASNTASTRPGSELTLPETSLRPTARTSSSFDAVQEHSATVPVSVASSQSQSTPGLKNSSSRNKKWMNSSAAVADLLTFNGCEELLRGTRFSTVLKGLGRIFHHPVGSKETYELSRQTARIDYFVSHNWTVPRWKKFICLSYYQNHLLGAASAFFTVCVIGILGLLHLCPQLMDQTEGHKIGFLARFFCVPAALFGLCFGHEVLALFGHKGPIVFLDKVCIHQEDQQLQRRGIAKLGAFIAESEGMLCIYSDAYLRKLWTVYEVAAFLTLHPAEDLKMLPTGGPIIAVLIAIMSWIVQASGVFMKMWSSWAHMQTLLSGLGCFALLYMFRVQFREKAAIQTHIRDFTVTKGIVTNEDDRAIIYENISILIRRSLQLDHALPQDKVLAAFDDLVRRELPIALRERMGDYVLSYDELIILSCLHDWPFLFDHLAHSETLSTEEVFGDLLRTLSWSLALTPFAVLLLQVMASRNLHYRGWKELLWFTASMAVCLIGLGVSSTISEWSAESTLGLVVFACMVAILAILVLVMTNHRLKIVQRLTRV